MEAGGTGSGGPGADLGDRQGSACLWQAGWAGRAWLAACGTLHCCLPPPPSILITPATPPPMHISLYLSSYISSSIYSYHTNKLSSLSLPTTTTSHMMMKSENNVCELDRHCVLPLPFGMCTLFPALLTYAIILTFPIYQGSLKMEKGTLKQKAGFSRRDWNTAGNMLTHVACHISCRQRRGEMFLPSAPCPLCSPALCAACLPCTCARARASTR